MRSANKNSNDYGARLAIILPRKKLSNQAMRIDYVAITGELNSTLNIKMFTNAVWRRLNLVGYARNDKKNLYRKYSSSNSGR